MSFCVYFLNLVLDDFSATAVVTAVVTAVEIRVCLEVYIDLEDCFFLESSLSWRLGVSIFNILSTETIFQFFFKWLSKKVLYFYFYFYYIFIFDFLDPKGLPILDWTGMTQVSIPGTGR